MQGNVAILEVYLLSCDVRTCEDWEILYIMFIFQLSVLRTSSMNHRTWSLRTAPTQSKKARITQNCLIENEIQLLDCIPNSLNLNLIEDVWGNIKKQFNVRKSGLPHCERNVWANIKHNYLLKLIESTPKRFFFSHTKY